MKFIEKFKNWIKRNLSVKEIIIFIAIVIVLVLANLQDVNKLGNFVCPKFIITYSDPEDLFINLFTIQATIAGLSLAIIALVSGVIDKTYYGISVSEFITSKRSKLFNHKVLLISDMVITGLDYFAVSMSYFNVSIILFFLSILITIKLIRDVFFVFKGEEVIKDTIHKYIIRNYSEKQLEQLNLKSKHYIQNNKANDIKEIADVVFDIFEREINGQRRQIILDKTIEFYINTLNLIAQTENVDFFWFLIQKIYDIYSINHNAKIKNPLNIWDRISRDYFSMFEKMSYVDYYQNRQLISDFRKMLYLTQFIWNEDGVASVRNNHGMQNYSLLIYIGFAEREKNKLTDTELKNVKSHLFNTLLYYGAFNKPINKALKDNIKYNEFLNLLLYFANKGDIDLLENEFYPKLNYNNKSLLLAFVIAYIYEYYLGYKENLANESKVINGKRLIQNLKANVVRVLRQIDFIDVVFAYRNYIKDFLSNYEIYSFKAKAPIMESTVMDFLLFTAICNRCYTNVISKMTYNELLLYAPRYILDKGNIKDSFDEFTKEVYNFTSINAHEEYEQFQNSLKFNIKLQEIRFAEKMSNEIHKEYVSEFRTKLIEICRKTADSLMSKFRTNIDSNVGNRVLVTNNYYRIYEIGTAALDDDLINESETYNILISDFFRECFDQTVCNKIEILEFDSSAKDIHTQMLNHISKSTVKPKIVYGNRDMLYYLSEKQFNESFENSKQFFDKTNFITLLDNDVFGLKSIDYTVETKKIDIDGMANLLPNGNYSYVNGFGVELEFTEEEMLDYLNKSYKKFVVKIGLTFEYIQDLKYIGVLAKYKD